jgi:hypothetical protein
MRIHSSSSPLCIAFGLLLLAGRPALGAEAVEFHYRPPQVGQHGTHEMQFQLELTIAVRQSGKTISSEAQQLSRDQQRQVTILEVADKHASKVEVVYRKAQESMGRGNQAGPPQTQPIEGKSYLVERRADDLVVTDSQGQPVPEEERTLVVASMQSVGRPSPLGLLLDGKKLTVGQTLRLPNAMASDVLGMKDTGGEPQKVDLLLREVRQDEGRRLARFDLSIILKLAGGGTMEIKGDLQIEPDTCQIAAANFSGPVSMREEHGPQGHTFEVRSEGTMKVAVNSREIK